jgi:hypothetical protein
VAYYVRFLQFAEFVCSKEVFKIKFEILDSFREQLGEYWYLEK